MNSRLGTFLLAISLCFSVLAEDMDTKVKQAVVEKKKLEQVLEDDPAWAPWLKNAYPKLEAKQALKELRQWKFKKLNRVQCNEVCLYLGKALLQQKDFGEAHFYLLQAANEGSANAVEAKQQLQLLLMQEVLQQEPTLEFAELSAIDEVLVIGLTSIAPSKKVNLRRVRSNIHGDCALLRDESNFYVMQKQGNGWQQIAKIFADDSVWLKPQKRSPGFGIYLGNGNDFYHLQQTSSGVFHSWEGAESINELPQACVSAFPVKKIAKK